MVWGYKELATSLTRPKNEQGKRSNDKFAKKDIRSRIKKEKF